MTACRLRYLDNLRILLCFLVVAHHAGQPYGPSEGAWPVHYPQSSALLAPFFSVNAAFFMGAFFFTAGLMMPAALHRAGKWSFLAGKVRRLVLPALVVGLMAAPPVVWTFGMAGVGQPFWPWWLWQVVGSWQPIFAHAWFLVHLALYAALYAALAPWLQLVRVDQLSHGRIVALIAGMALSQYLLRIPFPIDDWVTIARTVPVEPAHLPQYACLFWLGILAGQGSFLRTFPDRTGLVWLTIGLAAAVLRYGQVYMWRGVGDPAPDHRDRRCRLAKPRLVRVGKRDGSRPHPGPRRRVPPLVRPGWAAPWLDRGGELRGLPDPPVHHRADPGRPRADRLAAFRAVPAGHRSRHGTLAPGGPAAPAGSAGAHRLS